jgi:hypothetical protein
MLHRRSFSSKVAVTALVGTIGGGAALHPADADAFERRVPAMSCVSLRSENYYYDSLTPTQWYKGPEINYYVDGLQIGPLNFYCPIPNDTSLNPEMITEARAWGFNSTGNTVTIYACLQWYNADSAVCGAGTTVSGAGQYDVAIGDISKWHLTGARFNVPLVFVPLPHANMLRGFYVHN